MTPQLDCLFLAKRTFSELRIMVQDFLDQVTWDSPGGQVHHLELRGRQWQGL